MRAPWAVWLLSALFLCLPAAAEKVARSVWAGDERAQQKVAAMVEGLPVGELLGLLTQKTGIVLSAESEIAEAKVVVLGPARPLRELLDDLAALFNAFWVRHRAREGRLGYHLERGEIARQYEARLAGWEAGFLRAQLQNQVRALSETPVQLARRPEDDPIRATLLDNHPDGAVVTRLYSWLTPEQQELLFRDCWLRRPWSTFTPPQKREIEDFVQEKVAQENKERLDSGEPALAADDPRGNPVDRQQELVRWGITFTVARRTGFRWVNTHLGSTTQLTVAFPDEFRGFLLPPHGNPYTREAILPEAPLPSADLSSSAMKENPWIDRLRHLAESSRRPVLADYYRTPPVTQADYYRHFNASTAEPGDPVSNEAPPSPTAALDALCQQDVYLWWVRGHSFLFRKRDWFTQQLYELPDRWMLEMISRLQAQKGIPTVDDMLRLRELSIRQLAGLGYLANTEVQYGEVELLGLQELLQLVLVSTRRPGGALPVREPTADSSLILTRLTPLQQTVMESFVAIQAGAALAMDRRFTRLLVSSVCRSSNAKVAFGGRDYRYVEVGVGWDLDTTRSEQSGGYSVYLPLSLADNRRDQTRVDLAP